MVLGFAALTRIAIEEARQAFERAIALDSALPLARLGLGLAKIRAGDLESGSRGSRSRWRRSRRFAAAHYLGKAYFEERRNPLDGEQYAIAKQLDPNDPTPWFYNAIRLQTINRPVEALHELEKSIELNDNRAVYRSRLLLDEDIAVRETSLARIYNDLGFEQVARVEATKSLNQDPANYSAHRFLSDTYAGLPRHEIARASRAPTGAAPAADQHQSGAAEPAAHRLQRRRRRGPGRGGIQRVHPAVCAERRPAHRDRHRRQQRHRRRRGRGDHALDRMSLSRGGTAFNTDGFRENNGDHNNLADAYVQVAVTPKLNLQAEYRYRDTDQGDLELNFDPDRLRPDASRDCQAADGAARLSAYSPSPNSGSPGLSLLYSDRNEDLS